MLIRFSAENHASLRERQELSWVASSALKETDIGAVDIDHNVSLLRVAALYGANASGKTTVLKAMHYFRSAIINSHRSWAPGEPISREPFLLAPETREQPSVFEVDLFLDKVRYQYGFSLTEEAVTEEHLYAFPKGRRQTMFERTAPNIFNFGKLLRGENRAIQALTRPNSLFLSAAAQNNHPTLLPIYDWFQKNLRFARPANKSSRFKATLSLLKEGQKEAVLGLLKTADLGIEDLVLDEQAHTTPEPIQQMLDLIKDRQLPIKLEVAEVLEQVSLVHRGRASGVRLPFMAESDGTKHLFMLAGYVFETLQSGGVLCIDELDASLHPSMALELVRLFNDPKRNPKNAQLLFNTHNTLLLSQKVLRRDQIWFTEKDSEGATHLYPLTDFKPRREENIELGYLQGRYGAVPLLNPRDFLETLGASNV